MLETQTSEILEISEVLNLEIVHSTLSLSSFLNGDKAKLIYRMRRTTN